MPGAVRLGDISQGHIPWPPRPSIEGSPNWSINKKPAVRVGDAWAIHCAGSCHGGVSSVGSPNWNVNGKPKVRKGDAISCGDTANQHSENFFVNG